MAELGRREDTGCMASAVTKLLGRSPGDLIRNVSCSSPIPAQAAAAPAAAFRSLPVQDGDVEVARPQVAMSSFLEPNR